MFTYCVAIITRNRDDLISICLNHIFKQSVLPNQVIVVDDSKNNKTHKIIKDKFNSVDYFHVNFNLGDLPKMRNYAIKKCTTDIIAFIDDDGFADIKWLENIKKTFESDNSIPAVGGRIIQGDESKYDSINPNCGLYNFYRWSYGSSNITHNNNINVKQFQGTNMNFKMSVLNEIGNYDELLCHGYASFEDTEICLRIYNKYGNLVFCPSAIVTHGLAPREKGFPRNMSSAKFVLSYARNGTYTLLKNYYKNISAIFCLFFLVPIVNFKRIFIDYNSKINFSNFFQIKRYLIFFNFILGLCQGVSVFLYSKKK
jgi:GT2 family glycosyltransferase